jgi:hypothetical protein
MTTEELQLIDEKLKGISTLVNAHMHGITEKLERIEAQTIRTNGRVTELEKKELTHVQSCPQAPLIRKLQDESLSNASVKKFISLMFVSGLAVGGFIVGLLKLIFG